MIPSRPPWEWEQQEANNLFGLVLFDLAFFFSFFSKNARIFYHLKMSLCCLFLFVDHAYFFFENKQNTRKQAFLQRKCIFAKSNLVLKKHT